MIGHSLAKRFLLVVILSLGFTPHLHAAEDNAVVAEALRTLFQSGKADTGSVAANAVLPSVREIYEIRDFKPIWVRDNGPKTKARALLEELKISGVHGLSPAFYHVAEIETLMAATRPDELARLDMLLSGAVVEFGSDLANGRIGPDLAPSKNIYINLADSNVKMVLGGRSELFVPVTDTAELDTLPTFFGEVTGVEVEPGDTPEIMLTVQSPFIDRIGGEGSKRSIAISDAAALISELLAVRAPVGETLDDLIASEQPAKVEFSEPLPLFVTFVTAWANRDGSVHFRRDTHGRDAKLAKLLQLD